MFPVKSRYYGIALAQTGYCAICKRNYWFVRKRFSSYSCVFRKEKYYRVLVSLSVFVCMCVCVFLHDNSKINRSRNVKFEYMVVYENSWDEFDIEHHRIKVKVTVGLQKFSPFTTIQTVRSYNSTLVQARKLILSFISY